MHPVNITGDGIRRRPQPPNDFRSTYVGMPPSTYVEFFFVSPRSEFSPQTLSVIAALSDTAR
jgi:hypothetical protein